MKRNLSGMFFRVKDGEKWGNVCFEDLTEEQQDEMMSTKSIEAVKGIAKRMAEVVKHLGDQFDIVSGEPTDD